MEEKCLDYLRVRNGTCSEEKFEGMVETVAYILSESTDTIYCLLEEESS